MRIFARIEEALRLSEICGLDLPERIYLGQDEWSELRACIEKWESAGMVVPSPCVSDCCVMGFPCRLMPSVKSAIRLIYPEKTLASGNEFVS